MRPPAHAAIGPSVARTVAGLASESAGPEPGARRVVVLAPHGGGRTARPAPPRSHAPAASGLGIPISSPGGGRGTRRPPPVPSRADLPLLVPLSDLRASLSDTLAGWATCGGPGPALVPLRQRQLRARRRRAVAASGIPGVRRDNLKDSERARAWVLQALTRSPPLTRRGPVRPSLFNFRRMQLGAAVGKAAGLVRRVQVQIRVNVV